MRHLNTVVDAASAYAGQPSNLAELLAPPSAAFSVPAPRDVLALADEARSPADLDALLRRVAPLVGASDPFRSAVMALLGGILVEQGADPATLATPLFARLPGFLAEARTLAGVPVEAPEVAFDANPNGFRAWRSLPLAMLPTMAVLARSEALRERARKTEALVEGIYGLQQHSKEAEFVARTLALADELELVVLHPAAGKGFRVRLEAVATMAHLFTLLQGELIGGGYLPGPRVDPVVMATARGESRPGHVTDEARFHFHPWFAMRTDGSLDPFSGLMHLGVEGRPQDIPVFQGERVLVLGPPAMAGRSWDESFFANFHDALRSSARVTEVLTDADVAELLQRIVSAQR